MRLDQNSVALPLHIAAAHELKSPLALIRQLALALESGEVDDIEAAATRIRLTSERSLRLAQDLTTSERLEDTLFELEPINIVALCEDVVREIEPLYRARQRQLRVHRRRQAPLVVANRQLLRSILLQFADNALQYSEADRPVEFITRTNAGGDNVRIGVRDYGPAIPSDIWRRIKLSSRSAVSSRPGSSGLGLHVARRFAETMNARVGVTRHRDGASFYLDLVGSTQTSLL